PFALIIGQIVLVSPMCFTRLGVGSHTGTPRLAAHSLMTSPIDVAPSSSRSQRCSNTARSVTKALASSRGKATACGPLLMTPLQQCHPGTPPLSSGLQYKDTRQASLPGQNTVSRYAVSDWRS